METFWISYRETLSGYFLQKHYEYRFQVLLMLEGETEYQIGQQRYTVRKGDVVLLNTLEDHTLRVKKYPYRRYIFQISPDFLHSEIQSPEILSLFVQNPESRQAVVRMREKNFTKLCQLCAQMQDEYQVQDRYFTRMILSDLNCFFVTVLRELAADNGSVHEIRASTVLSYRILQYLDHHFSDDITVAGVAEHFYLSRHYISHIFKQTTGRGIMEYVISRRINRAQMLLTESALPVGRIAQECGYSDFAWFSKQFRKVTGQTPTQFRTEVLQV
ncbi:MAG: helix-turn-helix domain-containing protein [Lachnospira sp.]|nr:helix-turn-helix domain-containing protein [Lachnospira sp.]